MLHEAYPRDPTDHSIETFEEAPVLVASIPELPPRDKPCHVTTRGTYEGSFIRTGDGDRKLSHYEIDRLIEEHSQPRHDARIVEGATEDDLDKTLVDSLVERERFLHPRIFEKLGKQDILKALRVLDEDENGVLRPTLAGLLALGFYPQKYFPRLTVSFAAYPGTTKATLQETGQRFLDSNDFVGPIPVMIAEAVSAVAKNMRTGSFLKERFAKTCPTTLKRPCGRPSRTPSCIAITLRKPGDPKCRSICTQIGLRFSIRAACTEA